MDIEEAIGNIHYLILELKADNYNYNFIKSLKVVLQYIKILENIVNNKYTYVEGGRNLYNKLMILSKEDLIKAYLRLRNEVNQYIKEKENSIPKKKGGIKK